MKERTVKMGFPPVYDEKSEVLILGSFPSVKSREISFYYGNKQNRFWATVCGFFGEEIPESVEEKKDFLHRRKIALWDMVTECEIVGSADASIENARTADLTSIFNVCKLKKILLNGALAYDLFINSYSDCKIPYVKMSSTSPANPRFSKEKWWEELKILKNNEDVLKK
ncbi:MAG: DNA-deoxyinosine glycosylase [Clostridia bacterium]|nr:DNA-deoxyinosine glycosylase [Clostridia bacterium]